MAPTALLILSAGAEEMEAVITIDVLRRAGITVTVAGLSGTSAVECSRGVVLQPDTSLEEVTSSDFSAVILPGGLKGAEHLAQSSVVGSILKSQESKADCIVAAICAAPIALKKHGVFEGWKITSYPNFKEQLSDYYSYLEDRVVVDGNLITSRGPGTAFEFALAIVEKLCGAEKAANTKSPLLLPN